MKNNSNLKKKICKNGHTFFKSSDCNTCPICEQEANKNKGFLSLISAPARRALEKEGIISLEILANTDKNFLKNLHGVGPNALNKLNAILLENGFNS